MLLYGRDPPALQGIAQSAYDCLSYPAEVQAKLAELQDFIHANIAQAASNQKAAYDQLTSSDKGSPYSFLCLQLVSWSLLVRGMGCKVLKRSR